MRWRGGDGRDVLAAPLPAARELRPRPGWGGAGSTPGFTPPPPLPSFPVCLQPVHCGSRENAETSKTSPSLGVLTVRAHGWLGPGSKGRVEQGSRSP